MPATGRRYERPLGEALPADVAEVGFILGKQLRSPGRLTKGQAMTAFNDDHERLSDDKIKSELANLFP
jgi:hypothetical protein